MTIARQKELGAYYTAETVVDFLVQWGLSNAKGVVLDPSCGDGRFLRSAAKFGASTVVGCDIDPGAIESCCRNVREPGAELQVLCEDFFSIEAGRHLKVDLVVGNPPFIRYQRFNNGSRAKALESAFRLGVRLTALTSTWAPFLLHALQFLRRGGAMAMVVPAEIVQTNYGVPTLRALCGNFASVDLIYFSRNIFASAQTETYLLLAAGKGGQCKSVRLHPVDSPEDLSPLSAGLGSGSQQAIDVAADGRFAFAESFMTAKEQAAWNRIKSHPSTHLLGELGDLTNGYVTGDNNFFHRKKCECAELSPAWLLPTVRSATSLRGVSFAAEDIEELESKGRAHHLLNLPADDLFTRGSAEIDAIIAAGEKQGVHRRYKCRCREPWWRVPGAQVPDVFVPYMIGHEPRFSANLANATHTNSLHGIKLTSAVEPLALAVALHSTVTLLSLELEGRSYGGGILKIEPSEARRLRVLLPKSYRRAALQMDKLLRAGEYARAVAVADSVCLGAVDMKDSTRKLLSNARERLVARRYQRARRKEKNSCP